MDIWSNLLSSINNGLIANQVSILVQKKSRLLRLILFLVKEGYLVGFELLTIKNKPYYRLFLHYNFGKPVISGVFRISKPSRKIYVNVETLRIFNNPYISLIISTSKGFLTGTEAIRQNIGGEVLFVFY
jgi:small subunit ribosomal protein S8